ncbi:MAG: GNAT family N-acetyltransferase, partial [Acidobacteria bacterium]|nr:GNAT family N-acetyltransferase [Acidobacteriota bacterium]
MSDLTTGSLLQFRGAPNVRARISKEILLRDGFKLRLRELRFEDRARLKAFFERCSAESIRRRFFRRINEFPESLLDQLLAIDGKRHVVLIATLGEGETEEIVAEGRAAAIQGTPQIADVAFLVQDELQRRGIATLLLNELTTLACRVGFTQFSADVLAENHAMLALIRNTGRRISSAISQGV